MFRCLEVEVSESLITSAMSPTVASGFFFKDATIASRLRFANALSTRSYSFICIPVYLICLLAPARSRNAGGRISEQERRPPTGLCEHPESGAGGGGPPP